MLPYIYIICFLKAAALPSWLKISPAGNVPSAGKDKTETWTKHMKHGQKHNQNIKLGIKITSKVKNQH